MIAKWLPDYFNSVPLNMEATENVWENFKITLLTSSKLFSHSILSDLGNTLECPVGILIKSVRQRINGTAPTKLRNVFGHPYSHVNLQQLIQGGTYHRVWYHTGHFPLIDIRDHTYTKKGSLCPLVSLVYFLSILYFPTFASWKVI